MVRVAVGCSELFDSIYFIAWSKISFTFFVKAFFCLFLTCVHHIYCIRVHWFWNLCWVFIENLQWAVSKLDMPICFSRSFMEGHGEGAGFLLHLSPSIYLFDPRQFLKFDNFWWVVDNWFINITEDCSFFWVSIFMNTTEAFYFFWVYRFIIITEDCSFCWGSI